jgi:hypothetical protein
LCEDKNCFDNVKKQDKKLSILPDKKLNETQNIWSIIKNAIFEEVSIGIPIISYNFIISRTKEAFQEIKRFARKHNFFISDVGRYVKI